MRNAAPDAQADALLASFERTGFARAAPAILQPAEPFLDLSGEDIRKRMYLTTDPQGQELCLRPDLTIPVSRDYLACPAAGKPQGFCYLGPVFRHRGDAPGEFLQAGVESFGRLDTPAADAEMFALGLEATAHYGLAAPDVRMGDIGLFSALIAALDLAPAWKRRLIKDFNHKSSLAQDLDRLAVSATRAGSEYQGVLAALAGSDPKAAHALVTDLLSIAGITAVGGRSVGASAGSSSPAAVMTACSHGSAASCRFRRSDLRPGSSGSPPAGAPRECAPGHRGTGQGPAAGERGKLLRARRARTRQAARRARLS